MVYHRNPRPSSTCVDILDRNLNPNTPWREEIRNFFFLIQLVWIVYASLIMYFYTAYKKKNTTEQMKIKYLCSVIKVTFSLYTVICNFIFRKIIRFYTYIHIKLRDEYIFRMLNKRKNVFMTIIRHTQHERTRTAERSDWYIYFYFYVTATTILQLAKKQYIVTDCIIFKNRNVCVWNPFLRNRTHIASKYIGYVTRWITYLHIYIYINV